MLANSLLTEAEAAARLHISIRTLRDRMAEAGVRGIKPGRKRLLPEGDFQTLIEYLARRTTNLGARTAPGVPVNVRRATARFDTARLLKKVPRPVVKLALEKGGHDGG